MDQFRREDNMEKNYPPPYGFQENQYGPTQNNMYPMGSSPTPPQYGQPNGGYSQNTPDQYPPQNVQYPPQNVQYPPQNPGYPPISTVYQPQSVTSVVVNQPTGGQNLAHYTTHFGPTPQRTLCPYCGTHGVTEVDNVATTKTHCIACCLFCFICWPCACLPYCMDSCQNQNHHCPQCKAYLGVYEH